MNKFVMTAIAASLAFANPVFAVDAHHPEKAPSAATKPAGRTGAAAPPRIPTLDRHVLESVRHPDLSPRKSGPRRCLRMLSRPISCG